MKSLKQAFIRKMIKIGENIYLASGISFSEGLVGFGAVEIDSRRNNNCHVIIIYGVFDSVNLAPKFLFKTLKRFKRAHSSF